MDIILSNLDDLVIPLANYARFSSGQRSHIRCVESRMFLWCKSGFGWVTINGRKFTVRPMDYFVLPWAHEVAYQADDTHPFELAGIHLIPWHDPDVELVWKVAHGKRDELFGSPCRQDREVEGLEELVHFQLSPEHRLFHLSEYVVQHFQSPDRDAAILRSCGLALISEARSALSSSIAIPRQLQRLKQFVMDNMSLKLSVDELAMEMDRSASQVNRLCQRHFGCSPGKWINQMKVAFACDQLLQTRLSIAEIARQVGFDDQFYFSRLFKKDMGTSPLKYRQKQPLI
jgi:AraC-like DNA-binding protein